ncbi:helix-turn-helix domain-containing protein [Clostridium senegalense]
MRMEKGLTQKQLGKRVGVTQQYISEIENGNIDGLTIGKAKRLAKVFNVCELQFIAMLLEHKCDKSCDLWEV